MRAAVAWLTFYRVLKTKHFYGISVYHEHTLYGAFSHDVIAGILVLFSFSIGVVLAITSVEKAVRSLIIEEIAYDCVVYFAKLVA